MQRTISRLAASLLLALLIIPLPGMAQDAAHVLHPDAGRCYQLRHSDPEAAARLAGERLAAGDLVPADALVFEACRAISRAIMGDAVAARAGVAAVESLLASHPMPAGYELRALSNAGATLQLAGDIAGALAAYERALHAAGREDAWEAQVTTLINLALLYAEEFAAYQEAEVLFDRAAELNDAHGERKAALSYNRGLNFLRMGQRDDARTQFERALATARSTDEGVFIARAEAELLALAAAPGGRDALQALLEHQRRRGDVSGAARSALLQARLALEAGDAAGAFADAERSLVLLPEGAFRIDRRNALELKIEALVATGEWPEAFQASTQLHEEQLNRLRAMQLGSMAKVQATLVDEHNLDELALARQQGEVSTLQALHQRRQRNLAITALSLLVLLALGFFAYQRRVTRRLRKLSTRDSLTRLLNRHAAGKRLDAMVPARVDAGDARTAVFLIDIDRFKAINDHHGHDAGDAALVAVAKALVAACGPEAVVARWGGEEFLVGCRGLDAAGAGQTAERLRQAIADMAFAGGVGPLTVSVGFAGAPVFPPAGSAMSDVESGHWPDAVILADRALYAAKRSGRNTWVGLWGRNGATVAIDDVLDDPSAAIAAGDLLLSAGRPGFAWPGPSRR